MKHLTEEEVSKMSLSQILGVDPNIPIDISDLIMTDEERDEFDRRINKI